MHLHRSMPVQMVCAGGLAIFQMFVWAVRMGHLLGSFLTPTSYQHRPNPNETQLSNTMWRFPWFENSTLGAGGVCGNSGHLLVLWMDCGLPTLFS